MPHCALSAVNPALGLVLVRHYLEQGAVAKTITRRAGSAFPNSFLIRPHEW